MHPARRRDAAHRQEGRRQAPQSSNRGRGGNSPAQGRPFPPLASARFPSLAVPQKSLLSAPCPHPAGGFLRLERTMDGYRYSPYI
nr:MAG TPA: hypothetical protein [Caudoviricetes sp.]